MHDEPMPGLPDHSAAGPLRLLRVALAHLRQERRARRPRAQLEIWQQHGLTRLRRFATERSPFYRELHRGLHDAPLQQLPWVDKTTLMANFDDVVTDRRIRLAQVQARLASSAASDLYLGRYVVLSTSGSTGLRGLFLFDPGEWIDALAAITRPLAWARAPRPWTRPRSAFVASTAPSHYSARISQDLATPLAPSLRCDATWPLDTLVSQLNRWQPQVLALYPSVLAQLADEQAAGRLQIAPRHIGTSAEVLPLALRQRAHAVFGVPVYDTYGATELAPIATQCEAGYLHLLEDRAIVEVVDDRGHAVPAGETGAQLLLTVLHRHTQPLIRYALGDRVRELPGACPCGRALRRLAVVEGRIEESLQLPAAEAAGDRTLHPNLLHTALETVVCSGWQVRQMGSGRQARLQVLLTGAHAADAEALQRALRALLIEHGVAAVPISVSRVDTLPRGSTGKAPLIMRVPA